MTARSRTAWTFAVTSIALFMVVLDNLVVSTAIPVIRVDLGASLQQLEWTVNAYTLTFAVFLLTGAALGDRSGGAACSPPASCCSSWPRRRARWRAISAR